MNVRASNLGALLWPIAIDKEATCGYVVCGGTCVVFNDQILQSQLGEIDFDACIYGLLPELIVVAYAQRKETVRSRVFQRLVCYEEFGEIGCELIGFRC